MLEKHCNKMLFFIKKQTFCKYKYYTLLWYKYKYLFEKT